MVPIEDIKLLKEVYTIYGHEIVKGVITSKREFVSTDSIVVIEPSTADRLLSLNTMCEVSIYVRSLGYEEFTVSNENIFNTKNELLEDLSKNSKFT